jgi:hypothetical protein
MKVWQSVPGTAVVAIDNGPTDSASTGSGWNYTINAQVSADAPTSTTSVTSTAKASLNDRQQPVQHRAALADGWKATSPTATEAAGASGAPVSGLSPTRTIMLESSRRGTSGHSTRSRPFGIQFRPVGA